MDLFSRIRRPDLDESLHTTLQVPVQEIAGTDKQLFIRSLSETIDSRVFQPAAYHSFDRDVLCLSRHTRPEAADTPDKEFYLDPGLRALNQFLHDLEIVHGVTLDTDTAVFALPNLAIQILDHSALKTARSNPEAVRLRRQFPLLQGQECSFRILSGFWV